MQLLAKFKKFWQVEFKATLNFQNFKVALKNLSSPMVGQYFDTMIVASSDKELL